MPDPMLGVALVLATGIVAVASLGAFEMRRLRAALDRARKRTREIGTGSAAPLAERLDAAARRLHRLEQIRTPPIAGEPFHILFTAPKTGATTLGATLGGLDLCHHIYNAHSLSGDGLRGLRELAYRAEAGPIRDGRLRLYRETCETKGRLAAGEATGVRPFVVTGIREPIARTVSGLWYRRRTLPDPPDPELVRDVVASEAVETFLDAWLRDELEACFDFAATRTPFDPERGYWCGEGPTARHLVIRLESFERLPDALGEFFEIDPALARVETRNRAADREGAELYREFLRSFRLDPGLVEQLYAAPYVRHFYTPREIEAFVRTWGAD